MLKVSGCFKMSVRNNQRILYRCSVLHTHFLQPGLKILEALAASGLRSIRYALEIPQLESVVANDFSKDAYTSMCKNIEHNGVRDKVKPSWREARCVLTVVVYECI